jgi:P-type E1-E2 ATPase
LTIICCPCRYGAVESSATKLEVTTRGETVIYVGIDGEMAGTVSMVDEVRQEAAATISALHKMGVKTSMLSGDKQWAADSVAAKVGISSDQVLGDE